MPQQPAPLMDLRSEPAALEFLLRIAEVANISLDLDEMLERVAAVVREAVPHDLFAILQLNEATQELRILHSAGHSQETMRKLRIPVGKGITGAAAAGRSPVLANDTASDGRYVSVHDGVRAELAVPLINKNRVVGVMDLQSTQAGHFTERHRDLLSLVAARLAVAIENARLYRSTLRQARTLATLTEISQEFASILQLGDLLRKIAELVRRLINYDAFSVLLLDEQAEVLKHYLSIRFKEQVQERTNIPVGKGIIGNAVAERRSLLIPDVERDARYINLNPSTRSELAVPLIVKDRVVGVLDLESTRRGFFTTRHLQAMEMLAPQVAIAIENARLYEKLAREEARMERDLAAARELQASLLPPGCPEIPNLQICARYEPARELGGDLYDFIPYDSSADCGPGLGIFIGDVSGKGSPAALYAALSSGLIRTTAARCRPTGQMLSKLNGLLCERRIEARSLALCYAVLDTVAWKMEVANAGLPHPLICRGGEVLPVRVEGVPLGLLEHVEYQATTLDLRPGDVVVFHSDGITENFDRHGEEFGRSRLRDIVMAHCGDTASKVVERIFEEAHRWSAGRAISDDRTAVVLKISEDPTTKGCGPPPCV